MPEEETPISSIVFDQLRQVMSNDSAGFVALYRDFLQDAWQTLQHLSESVEQHHFENIQARAHYLKSSSLVLGAPIMAHRATEVERAAITKDLSNAVALVDDARRALQQVQAELARKLGDEVIPRNQAAA